MRLMQEISDDKDLTLQVLVSGTHLSKKFDRTIQYIEQDGFEVSDSVDIGVDDSSVLGICTSQGKALELYAKSLSKLSPDIAVVLGDRFEALSFAIACSQLSIPLAHIHGGELTLGATDDGFRHAITKLSYWHFTAANAYLKRVIQLGESPERVWNFGAPGVENIRKLKFLNKEELSSKLNISWKSKNLLITFHPETNTNLSSMEQIKNLLSALDGLANDIGFIFTYPNADQNSDTIRNEIEQYVARNSERSIAFKTMGQLNYLSTMKLVDAVVGNSSSGLIEAPSFNVATVNIGNRQKGRIRSTTVIDCGSLTNEIFNAINFALQESFRVNCLSSISPLEGENTASKIKEILKNQKIPLSLQKEFYESLE
jgi:UDP-hydrolysing UDP-N-acetyl-D-glucosamine 2-epimerase